MWYTRLVHFVLSGNLQTPVVSLLLINASINITKAIKPKEILTKIFVHRIILSLKTNPDH